MPKPEVDVGVVYFTPLKQPYIDLPFPMVEKVPDSKSNLLLTCSLASKVVTTIFHGKQKQLKNTVGQLFPRPMAKHFSEQMIAEAGLRDSRLRAIDLNMAAFSSLCHSYQVGL